MCLLRIEVVEWRCRDVMSWRGRLAAALVSPVSSSQKKGLKPLWGKGEWAEEEGGGCVAPGEASPGEA